MYSIDIITMVIVIAINGSLVYATAIIQNTLMEVFSVSLKSSAVPL